jgi:hypothetical protein
MPESFVVLRTPTSADHQCRAVPRPESGPGRPAGPAAAAARRPGPPGPVPTQSDSDARRPRPPPCTPARLFGGATFRVLQCNLKLAGHGGRHAATHRPGRPATRTTRTEAPWACRRASARRESPSARRGSPQAGRPGRYRGPSHGAGRDRDHVVVTVKLCRPWTARGSRVGLSRQSKFGLVRNHGRRRRRAGRPGPPGPSRPGTRGVSAIRVGRARGCRRASARPMVRRAEPPRAVPSPAAGMAAAAAAAADSEHRDRGPIFHPAGGHRWAALGESHHWAALGGSGRVPPPGGSGRLWASPTTGRLWAALGESHHWAALGGSGRVPPLGGAGRLWASPLGTRPQSAAQWWCDEPIDRDSVTRAAVAPSPPVRCQRSAAEEVTRTQVPGQPTARPGPRRFLDPGLRLTPPGASQPGLG